MHFWSSWISCDSGQLHAEDLAIENERGRGPASALDAARARADREEALHEDEEHGQRNGHQHGRGQS